MQVMSDLRISVLGKLTASYAGEVLDLGGRRQRAVLAVLVLARGEVVAAERLVDCVWGERASGRSHAALQSYVSHLRRCLQPTSPARTRSAVIVREGTGYAVRLAEDAVDAWRFEELVRRADTAPADEAADLLTEALGLWRGPALGEYADEAWAKAGIAALHELRTVARERLLAARLEHGQDALLVPELEAMVAEEPLREERWRLLALALYRAHRQADALAALRRARETLLEELGVDPGPALQELEGEVLRHSPALVVPAPRSGAPTAPVAERPRRHRDPLVDRERELEALQELVEGLAAGDHGLCVVEGPAGIGKTRLLEELRLRAAHLSVPVLTSRGSPLETAFGFGVVRQLLEPVVADPERGPRLLGGAAAGARGVFDPSGAEGAGHAEGPAEGFAVLHGLFWLTLNLAGDGPLLLVVDDAQWCDAASLRFLAYLARRLDTLPLAVVVAVRSGERPEHDELLAELTLEPSTTVLRPVPISEEATASLVERRLGTAPAALFVTACHRTTSGNPLLLDQLLRALAEDRVRPDASHADKVVAVGSRAVSSMVLLRLRRMPGEVVEVARAAAVLGDGASLPAVAALAELPEPATADGLATLARLDVVRNEQPLAFVHPLVRDAVYRALPAADRELRHERAAAVLRASGGSEEQVAAHLLLAPPRGDDGVVAVLVTAARSAAGRGAVESAVTYLRRALREVPSGGGAAGGPRPGPDRPDLVLQLGLLEAAVDGTAAVAHLDEAYRLHEDPRARADIAVIAAATHVFASPPGVATAFARQAEAALPADLDDQRQALVALQRIGGFMHGLEQAWRTPAPEPQGDGLGAQMLAATVALEALLDRLDRATAVRMGRLALRGDRLIAVEDGLFWVNAAAVLTLCDDDLGDFWSRARAASLARGSVFAALSASLWEGFSQWRRGEVHEALACLRAALDHDRLWGGNRVGEPFARAFQIGCHLDRGDVAAARRAADEFADAPGFGEGGRLFVQAVARLLVAEGRCEDALSALDRLAVAPMGLVIENPVWNPWRGIRAAALHGCGRIEEARALADEEVALLRRWGAPSYLGRALCQRAQLRGEAGLGDLTEAVELLAATSAAGDLAAAQYALGCRPEVADAAAVPLLVAAERYAERYAVLSLRDRARAELVRRGQRLEPCDEVRPPLTTTERRVLQLSDVGLDPREIAQRLFLTPGTVHAVLDEARREGPAAAGTPQVFLKSTS